MSRHPNINFLVSYGTEGEQKLLPILSKIVGSRLHKTKGTFDTMDMEGKGVFAELKRRSCDWSYTDKKIKQEGWLMPLCKILRGQEEISQGKKVFFFYFWSRDKSLWSYEFKSGNFKDAVIFVPKGHYDNQLHVAIPQEQWTRHNVDLSWLIFADEESMFID